jgi:hypothetical protein
MPITSTIEVVNTLSSLTFNQDGTLDATFTVMMDGVKSTDKHFHLDLPTSIGILDAPIPEGFETMRQGVIVGVYKHLLTAGLLVGTMS